MPNETDIVAQLEAARTSITNLTLQVATVSGERDAARTQLSTVTGERDTARTDVTRLTGERDTANGQVTALTNERNEARASLGAAHITITGLQATQKDFDARLTGELVKLGIRKEAVTQPTGEKKTGDTKLTATEQVIAHKANHAPKATV